MAYYLSSNLLHLHESYTTPLPSIELLQMAPRRRSRAVNYALSSEVRQGLFDPAYNMRTGRPVRQTRKADSPFVDSAIAVSDEEDTSDEELSSKRQSRKRKRSVSPVFSTPTPELHPTSDADSESEGEFRPKQKAPLRHTGPNGAVQMTLNNVMITVPEGHQGPIMLQFDPKTFTTTVVPQHTSQPVTKRARITAPAPEKRAGFLDLPAELRNEVYRQVFVADGKLDFSKPTNFSRGAAFLRTCHQVHEEARSILYAENEFFFSRRSSRYGSFWQDEWRELGFRAVHQFVKSIGPINLGLIRNVSFQLEDATPCLNPDSMSHNERRFVNDDILMSTLRTLGDYAQLQKLHINFHGRRRVETSDSRFLEYFTRIKADEIDFIKYPIGRGDSYFSSESKQAENVRKMLLKTMVRKHKLYD